eukprot:Sspe_Gene.9734::Locus_3278_Transcript_2_2_Confidence_0.750_Length_922::g.9734::m.9734
MVVKASTAAKVPTTSGGKGGTTGSSSPRKQGEERQHRPSKAGGKQSAGPTKIYFKAPVSSEPKEVKGSWLDIARRPAPKAAPPAAREKKEEEPQRTVSPPRQEEAALASPAAPTPPSTPPTEATQAPPSEMAAPPPSKPKADKQPVSPPQQPAKDTPPVVVHQQVLPKEVPKPKADTLFDSEARQGVSKQQQGRAMRRFHEQQDAVVMLHALSGPSKKYDFSASNNKFSFRADEPAETAEVSGDTFNRNSWGGQTTSAPAQPPQQPQPPQQASKDPTPPSPPPPA